MSKILKLSVRWCVSLSALGWLSTRPTQTMPLRVRSVPFYRTSMTSPPTSRRSTAAPRATSSSGGHNGCKQRKHFAACTRATRRCSSSSRSVSLVKHSPWYKLCQPYLAPFAQPLIRSSPCTVRRQKSSNKLLILCSNSSTATTRKTSEKSTPCCGPHSSLWRAST